MHRETHQSIFSSGWVGILAKWKQDANLLVTLPATKALANLDQKYTNCVYAPGIYLLLPKGRQVRHLNPLSNWGVDVVFIHGLLGGVFYSWRQLDLDNSRGWGTDELISSENYAYCWPRDWLDDMSENVRILGVDFDSYLSQWGNTCPNESFRTSLKDRSLDILSKLRSCGVGQRPVIFVGHSMGGLIVKQMLAYAQQSGEEDLQNLVNNTKGFVLYSTPHFGTTAARLNAYTKRLVFPSTELQDLEAGSPHLAELHHKFLEIVKSNHMQVISFGETLPTRSMGLDVTYVPLESSNPGVGKYYKVEMNHINICKPGSKKSILFRKLHRLIWDVMDETTPFE